ncbi:MAG: hypothetical protein GC204_09295 [Chloroflexi bacterium]|nr:hypothetical protein [Chloroflexota bacterium]
MKKWKARAVSDELIFVATHEDEVIDILDNDIVDQQTKQLTEAVYKRANVDAASFLETSIRTMLSNIGTPFGVAKRMGRSDWEVYVSLTRKAGRSTVRLGSIGLRVGAYRSGPVLLGFVNSLGGTDRRRRLLTACKPKMPKAHLTSDKPSDYPEWNNCLIWFEYPLSERTKLEDISFALAAQTKVLLTCLKLGYAN